MCYSKELSKTSFIFSIVSGLALIKLGNKKSLNTNKAIGFFFMFVSLMQLIEYFIWKDLDCNKGMNRLASIFGPILNHLQPIVMLGIFNYFTESNGTISKEILLGTNSLYLIYVFNKYKQFLENKNNLCVGLNNENHINWTWKQDFNYGIYIFMSFFNSVNYFHNKNYLLNFILSYTLLAISMLNFKQNIGEFWCLLVTGLPLFNIGLQKIFCIDN